MKTFHAQRSVPTRLLQTLALALSALLALPWTPLADGDEPPQASGVKPVWQAGFAETDITPLPGQAMLAGFGRERFARGALDPLRAQVLALRDADGRHVVLITADVLGFGRISVDAMRRKIAAQHQIPAKAVCFAASHTHWGPAINERTNFAIGGPNVWYLARLEETLVGLVDEALVNLQPASIEYGSCEVQIGMCRRHPGENGQIRWAPFDRGSYDEQTPVLRIRRAGSPQEIIVIGHACHPTSTGLVGKWSPDYPGAMRNTLESKIRDCRAMFVMGCGGDAKVVARDERSGDLEFAASPEQSDAAGVRLAEAVLEYTQSGGLTELAAELRSTLVRGSLSFQEPRTRGEIEQLALSGDLRAHPTWWARQSLAYPDSRNQQPYEVQAWQLGDLTMIALEGEVCGDWGPMARAMAPTRHAMVIAYANHCPGYIPTARIVREGGYEGDTSHMAYFLPAPFAPRVELELTHLIRSALGTVDRRPPPLYADQTNLLSYIDEHGESHPVTDDQLWQIRRKHILGNIDRLLGPVPEAAFRVPLELEVVAQVELEKYTRRKIAYNVDPYDRVESYLLIPRGLRGKAPAMLALHQTGALGKAEPAGLGGDRHQHTAHELAERGYIVLAPDYWPMGHYGDKDYDPYQHGYASGSVKGVWNHMRALDVLEQMVEVDADRIGCIGHSLGGYNALFLAARDPRIKAIVSSAGYNSFGDYAASEYGGGDLANWSLDKHLRRIRTVFDDAASSLPVDFPEVVAALAPRPFFTSAPRDDHIFVLPGVTRCIAAAQPVYTLLGAGDNLQVVYPPTGHDFPDEQRAAAYRFLDGALERVDSPE